jgi:Protein of unknown function (DUF3108)
MVAWLKPFLLALIAALCLHLIGIVGIDSQLPSSASVLDQRNDPLFTRTISAASTPEPVTPAATAPTPRAPERVASVINSAPVQPTPTSAPAEPATQPDSSATETQTKVTTASIEPATPSVAEITPTVASEASAQTITSAPTGSTDSLLITGEWPGDTRVSYVLTGYFRGELFGSGQVQWTRAGQNNERYQVRVTVDAGLVELRMTSQGRVSAQGLLPEAFEESVKRALQQPRLRTLKLEETELVLDNGRRLPRPATQPQSVQDVVSQFIDLGHRLSMGREKLEEGQVIRIWLGRPGGLDEWVYDVAAAEEIQLPRIGAVTVHALKPRPLVTPRGTISMSMWLAPSLQYLPAKIRIQLNPEAYVELFAEQLLQR